MKAKVIIENKESLIVLMPENEFEKTLIENAKENKANQSVLTSFEVDPRYGYGTNHRIEISIKTIK